MTRKEQEFKFEVRFNKIFIVIVINRVGYVMTIKFLNTIKNMTIDRLFWN